MGPLLRLFDQQAQLVDAASELLIAGVTFFAGG
jgi:hypothetical protein